MFMCWIVNDRQIMDMVFSCCPRHRPLISEMLISDQVVKEIKRVRPNVSQVQLEQIQRNVTHDPRDPRIKLPNRSAPIPVPTPIPVPIVTPTQRLQTLAPTPPKTTPTPPISTPTSPTAISAPKPTTRQIPVCAPEELGSNATVVKPSSFVENLKTLFSIKGVTK